MVESFENHYRPAAPETLPLSRVPEVGPYQTAGRLVAFDDEQMIVEAFGARRSFSVSSKNGLHLGDILEVLVDSKNQISQFKILVPSKVNNPLRHALDFEIAKHWQKFLAVVRSFLIEKEFMELRTPTLVSSPGLEPNLDVFQTKLQRGKNETSLYLPTSPEFHLKKALTQGFHRIFEFKECFRNNEIAQTHQPEFLMLEWYRAFETNRSLIQDLSELINRLQKEFNKPIQELQIFKMEEVWKKFLDFNLTPQTSREDLVKLAHKAQVEFPVDEDADDLFLRIFLERIENRLKDLKAPVIVWHYPPSQAALARLTDDGWADRFELYWNGFEIANAFHELNDPKEQRLRFQKDQREKAKRLGEDKVVPIDEEFLNCLDYGMPPSAGIAVGVERLFMALFELDDIRKLRLFPIY